MMMATTTMPKTMMVVAIFIALSSSSVAGVEATSIEQKTKPLRAREDDYFGKGWSVAADWHGWGTANVKMSPPASQGASEGSTVDAVATDKNGDAILPLKMVQAQPIVVWAQAGAR